MHRFRRTATDSDIESSLMPSTDDLDDARQPDGPRLVAINSHASSLENGGSVSNEWVGSWYLQGKLVLD